MQADPVPDGDRVDDEEFTDDQWDYEHTSHKQEMGRQEVTDLLSRLDLEQWNVEQWPSGRYVLKISGTDQRAENN